MESKLIIVLLAVIMMCSLVGATVETHQVETDLDVRHAVRKQGAPTSTATCNMTAYDPSWNVLVDFQEMTYHSASQTVNYTISSSNITELGELCYDITCLDSGLNETLHNCIEITPTGKQYTTAQSITFMFLFILAIFFFILTLYGAVVIPYKNKIGSYGEVIAIDFKKYLKLFLIAMSYGFLVLLSFLGWTISYGFLSFVTVGYFFKVIFISLMALAPVIFLGLVVFSVISIIFDQKTQKLIDGGFGMQDAIK